MRRAQNRERPSGGSGYEEQRRAEMERREEFTFTEQRERKLVALWGNEVYTGQVSALIYTLAFSLSLDTTKCQIKQVAPWFTDWEPERFKVCLCTKQMDNWNICKCSKSSFDLVYKSRLDCKMLEIRICKYVCRYNRKLIRSLSAWTSS